MYEKVSTNLNFVEREKEIVEQILREAPEFVLIEEAELNRKVLQYYVRSGDKGE